MQTAANMDYARFSTCQVGVCSMNVPSLAYNQLEVSRCTVSDDSDFGPWMVVPALVGLGHVEVVEFSP